MLVFKGNKNTAEIKDKINHTDNYNEIVELLNRVKDNLLSEPRNSNYVRS